MCTSVSVNEEDFLDVNEHFLWLLQLLYALKQSHERGVCHGTCLNITCFNFWIDSWISND